MIKPDQRQYRDLRNFETVDASERVTGYAALWGAYPLYEQDGITVYEEIHRDAFNGADMSDIICLYDHQGQVFARQSNGTLQVSIDDIGLHIEADLSRTKIAKEMYEQIREQNVTGMSWAFTIDTDGDSFDKQTRTRHITKIKKVYDVSFVSRGANASAYVQARSEQAKNYFNGVLKSVQELQARDALMQEYLEKRQAI